MERADFRRTLMTMQTEYVEMPGLRLTVAQAARLWAVPVDLCRAAAAALVAAGFLEDAGDGAFRRRGTSPVYVEPVDSLTWIVGRSQPSLTASALS